MVNIGLLFVLMAVKKVLWKWVIDHGLLAETVVGDMCILVSSKR